MPHIEGPRLVAALVGGVVALQALMLFAFAWPAANSGPREVPIAVAGPPESLQQIAELVGTAPSRDEGVPAIEPVQFADAAAATTAITEREVYGAIVVGPDGAEVLVASAASPAVAQFLRSAALELSQEGGVPIAFTDVVPTSVDDPTGAGLAAGVLPLVMTSAAGGFAAALALRRWAPRLIAVAGLSVAGGLASAAILQYSLGVTAGSYWSLAGVLMLLIGAVSAAVAGLGSVLGRARAVLGALLVIFLGNPLSAAPSAPEFLPQPWGELGQLLPPGAGVTAVRSVAFFDGAAVGTPVLVLSAWAFIGLALIVLGALVGRSRPAPASAGGSGSVPDRGTDQARSGTSA